MGMRHPWASLTMTTLLAAASLLASAAAHAGYDEGKSAYDHGDFAQALHEWRPLAEQGNAKAQKRLGDMYAGAEGVQRNYRTAIEWYGKAADQGLAGAQNSLGLIYESGEGVPATPKWLSAGTAGPHHRAISTGKSPWERCTNTATACRRTRQSPMRCITSRHSTVTTRKPYSSS